jgi:fructose 1,6-bisphosphate aldolase/phosphatase
MFCYIIVVRVVPFVRHVSCLVFSIHNGRLTGPHDGFGTVDWDLQRIWASERAMIMRRQGFIHPATLVPEELEYNKGYQARMNRLNEKFKDISEINNSKRNNGEE